MIKGLLIKVLLITATLGFASISLAEDDHSGHSDDLLLILKDKIALQKHLKQYPDLQPNQQAQSLVEQQRLLKQALLRLRHYVATPESRYPNMAMYHESLKSRAALIEDFAQLLLKSQCVHQSSCHDH